MSTHAPLQALAQPVLPTAIVDAFRAQVRGQVITPAAPEYDEARSVWNGMIDRRPSLIVRCLGVADVVACVNAARELQLPLSIKGGGHNIAGLAVCEGGVMLDMSLMRGVRVDVRGGRAHAQAGCLLGDVDRETQLHGLAAVLGFVSATGIAGLTLCGGFGYLSRKYGWTTDTVQSMELVTADGRVVRAAEDENADLFWGLRGGGGNFGVVTHFEYKLQQVGPEIVGGAIAWPIERAPEVLAVYRRIAEEAPRELALVAALRIAPPAPWIAKEMHGRPIVALFYCHTGSVAEGERLAAPLRQLGGAVGDVIQRRPYTSQQSLLDATQPKGRRYYWKSEYLPGLSDDLFASALQHADRLISPHSAVILFPLGGATTEQPTDHSAVGNRDAQFVLNITSAWEMPDEDAANIEWARSAWQDMRRFSTGGVYVNFLTEEEGDDRVRAAYGANLDRLAALKKTWDPGNLFRVNKNIAPR